MAQDNKASREPPALPPLPPALDRKAKADVATSFPDSAPPPLPLTPGQFASKEDHAPVTSADPPKVAAELRAAFERKGPNLSVAPPPISTAAAPPPPPATAPVSRVAGAQKATPPPSAPIPPSTESGASTSIRRTAKRRPAGPVRGQVAANDDVPSIGGLIYALDQQPENTPFRYASIASGVWAVFGIVFAWIILGSKLGGGASLGTVIADPTTFLVAAAIVVPIALMWFLALLAWRAEELRLRSSAMTEVAIRLAEPDRMAEQSIASLGQAVRRQVSFMNDAVSRALGRAGELEALVHNEVAALERSYEENERKIRGLIQELSGERLALLGTSERVTDTLRSLGTEIPTLIDRLSNQQIKLATIISSAGENLTSLETAVGQTAGRLETTLGERTEHLEGVLGGYTEKLSGTLGTFTDAIGAALEDRTGQIEDMLEARANNIGTALEARTDHMQSVLESYTFALAEALGARTEQMQSSFAEHVAALNATLDGRSDAFQGVFEQYAQALDSALANRAQILDSQLIERTRALDGAFSERLAAFDDSIRRSTYAIDAAVGERAGALTSALDNHAKVFSTTIKQQTAELDEQLVQGINAVRRTSENITRQSLKAIEGLSGQSEMLRNVSENLLTQIHSVTNRFENQGQAIMRAASALDAVNYKIDNTLQIRHNALEQTLDKLSGKATEFTTFVGDYSSQIEGQLSEAELKARAAAEELRRGADATKRAALSELERLRNEADAENTKRLEELRNRFATVSSSVNQELASLTSRVDVTAEEARQRTSRAAAEIAAEQARIRDQLDGLPTATRETAETMRRALADQLKALDQLSQLSQRTNQARDVTPPTGTSPIGAPPAAMPTATGAMPGPRAPAPPAGPARAPAPDGRDNWSLGDLLARASREEVQGGGQNSTPANAPPAIPSRPATQPAGFGAPPASPASQQAFGLNVEVIARALDPATTAALWSRLNAGHRGVLSRALYTAEGRTLFDEITRRLPIDAELARTVQRFLEDFDRIRREADARDPTGRATQNHLLSETGRVYLFLAHAAGRLG
ncbi:MAG: hypothetical protein NW216_01345 [Hyphomicrobium sp.]|nr:hypothetical protein [Hyphomicrobium sp.]